VRPSHRRHDRNYVPGPKAWRAGRVTLFSATEILKDLWPQSRIGGGMVRERSWAAKLARDRHWTTWEQYFAMPLVMVHRKSLLDEMYEPSPFFALLRRDTTFTPETA
jgi:hypothetical protein